MVKRPRLGVVIGKAFEDCKPPQVGGKKDVEPLGRRRICFEGVRFGNFAHLLSCFWPGLGLQAK